MVMKIKFVIDKDYDAKMVIHMLRGKDWEYRAQKMGFDMIFVKTLHNASEKQLELILKDFQKFVEEDYFKILPYMEKTKEFYQNSWNEIMNEFSETVEELTYPWMYKEYVCVLTNYNAGISNWNGNKVARWWKENPYLQRRITAHEILLAHYFSIHRKYFSKSGLTDRQIWALAEISAFALTGLEDKLKKFWPWDASGYYTNHNYQHLVELQNKLKEPFLKRKNYKEYINKGIELVKEYSPSPLSS